MRAKLLGVAVMLVLLGTMPSQATPLSLVDQGDNTYDPNTGLLWLDVNLTTNISYNTMVVNLATPSYQYYGYHYATGAEVGTLFTDAGITYPYIGSLNFAPTPDVAAYAALQALIGITVTPANTGNPGVAGTQGVIADQVCCGSPTRYQVLLYIPVDALQRATIFEFGLPDSYANQYTGSFLVTEAPAPTPLPAALPLFATGLGALGLLGWRRKRKAAAAIAAA